MLCACADGHIYIFSPEGDGNVIDELALSGFRQRVSSFKINKSSMSGTCSSTKGDLNVAGEKIGQVKLIKSPTGTEVFQVLKMTFLLIVLCF